ncbi:MAG: ABC transporter permease [Streptosporangiales bacterium]|nr:ABC transporter permease [Streptosporangiales bacterium]MBO0891463.1 ABC transporter permease [Acidothermales bacterium]
MTVPVVAVRAGLTRGRIEFRNTLTSFQDIWSYLFPAVGVLVAMFFTSGAHVPGTTFSLGSSMLPSVLGMNIAFAGLMNLSQQLVVEREDGTLLRAKAIPDGMIGYLVGKVTQVSAMALLASGLVVVPGVFLVHGLALTGVGSWLTLVWVVVLGLLATMPLGAVIGSMFSTPRNMGLVMLPIMALTATSGIFYPLSQFPAWLQWVGQVFPMYWLGLGMRSALLPGALSAVEIGGSWRHLATLGVLGGWAVAGMVVAPVVLRRMARRESGSSVAARRERAMRQVVR